MYSGRFIVLFRQLQADLHNDTLTVDAMRHLQLMDNLRTTL